MAKKKLKLKVLKREKSPSTTAPAEMHAPGKPSERVQSGCGFLLGQRVKLVSTVRKELGLKPFKGRGTIKSIVKYDKKYDFFVNLDDSPNPIDVFSKSEIQPI